MTGYGQNAIRITIGTTAQNTKVFKALDKLYSLGFEHGFYDDLIKAEDYLIPSEYKELRDS